MAAKQTPPVEEAPERIGAGYMVFRRIAPRHPERKFEGSKLYMPDDTASGKSEFAQVVYGRITGCGLAANRTTIEPFSDDIQKKLGFPLEVGTWICARNASHHKVSPHRDALQTHDLIASWPPDCRPPWAGPEGEDDAL